jgi:hypothetical protein
MTLHTTLVLSSYFTSIPSHGGRQNGRCNIVSVPKTANFATRSQVSAYFWDTMLWDMEVVSTILDLGEGM